MKATRDDELSLHMRIPAESCYLENVMLTLDGICDHYSLPEHSRERGKKALQTALAASIEANYSTGRGLFELSFDVLKDRLRITVEDMKILEQSKDCCVLPEETLEEFRKKLLPVDSLADRMMFREKNSTSSSYSMEFSF